MLAEFLYQAIHVPPGTPTPDRSVVELPELRRYIEGFGRFGDACMVAKVETSDRPLIVGAAWARIFPRSATGYGTIDTATPEVSISLFPDWRDQGIGRCLMTVLLASCGPTVAPQPVSRSSAPTPTPSTFMSRLALPPSANTTENWSCAKVLRCNALPKSAQSLMTLNLPQ